MNLNGGTFTFTPQDDVVLDAGNRYTYTVNVNTTGLTLEGSTISAWTEGEGEDGAGEIVDYTYDEDTNTYTVYTPKGLFVWNEAAQDDLSTNIILAKDIDWTGIEWTPVGDEENPYTGTFEGNGFTITGLTVNQSSTDYVGLIGGLGSDGVVQNLTLYNVSIIGYSRVGAVVGINSGGTVTDCTSSGSVSGNGNYVGGVVGYNTGIVTDCNVSGTVTGSGSRVGGVVGINDHGSVTACYHASGSVSGTYSVGGVAGQNDLGVVTACYASGSVSGIDIVGGVVGYNFGIVTTCYWSNYDGDGIGSDSSASGVTKVDGENVFWSDAVDGMNDALQTNQSDWRYEITEGNTLPTLTKNE